MALPTTPYGTITIDEQAAAITATLPSLHAEHASDLMIGAPAWCAIDALRAAGGWLTWPEWVKATAAALTLEVGGTPWPDQIACAAEQACRSVSVLAHAAPDGRLVYLREVEDRERAQDPWRVRARRFAREDHPPLRAARWAPERAKAARRPRPAQGEQMSLLEAA